MKHLASHITVPWEREFPVKVNFAKRSIVALLANEIRIAVDHSLVEFCIVAQAQAPNSTLSDSEFITEDLFSSLCVYLSFPEGNLYKRAGQLRVFLLELGEIDLEDNLLMLPDAKCPVFKYGQLSFITVRDCYPRLFDRIVNRAPLVRVALSGTPGIGKTCFLIYFLWRLVVSELKSSNLFPRILFHDKKGDRFVLQEDGSVYPLINQPGYAQDQEDHPNMWYLVDSIDPELTPYLNILLVTSPNENLVKHHNKDAIPFATWYMPLWDENEIDALIAIEGDSPVVRNNQKKFGNIPRTLFTTHEDSLFELEKAWDKAVGSITRQALINVLAGSDKDAKIFHHVIHVHVPKWSAVDPNTGLNLNDFTTTHLKFASEMSQEAIIVNLCKVRSHELESLLEEAATASIAASLCGNIFEAYAFRSLQDYSSYPWHARVLVNENTLSPLVQFRPCCGTNFNYYREFDNGSGIDFSSIPSNALCKARRKNYSGIDGFCADGIFNMAVGAEHGIILKDELIELVQEGIKKRWFQVCDSSRNAIQFLFFVPWYAFGSWRQVQSVTRGSHKYVDPTNLRSLNFELVQVAIEVPRPNSLVYKIVSS
jgi:hypothetical protein